MSNHSPENDPKMTEYLNEQLRKALEPHRPGPTGNFPRGRLTPSDEGEIRIAVGSRKGTVVIDFGKPTAWIGFPPDDARKLAASLIAHADAIEGNPPRSERRECLARNMDESTLPATDTISVSLSADDLDLIEWLCGAALAAISNAPQGRVAELRDRLKRAMAT